MDIDLFFFEKRISCQRFRENRFSYLPCFLKTIRYLFDQDLIELHNEVWKLWKQYLNSDDPENKTIYDTLNSRITGLHNLITDRINIARKKRDEIIENSYS